MDISVQQGELAQVSCDLLVVNLFAGVTAPAGGTGAVDAALGGWISKAIAEQDFKGKLNSTLLLDTHGAIPATRVLLVGLGESAKFGAEQIRQASSAAIKAAKKVKAKTVVTILHGAGIAGLPAESCAQAVAEGALLGGYSFAKYKSKNEDVPVEKLIIVEHDAAKIADIEKGIYLGTTIATAVNTTRDLANEPPNVVTPQFLAEYARQMSAELGLQCTIWEGEQLVAERMNCLLAVGRASANPPCFIRVDYSPESASKRVALVGKGLCYDSGGLSLKPAEHMRHMKTDMAGAASVLGALSVIARLKPGVAVSAFLPICENMVSGTSYKVDDVLTARNGVTIEIDNTDAEGRLVLADALSVAAEGGFDEIIDVATLTGGCMVALARRWTGIMGNNQPLIDAISAAGNHVGERMWNLPLDEEIREMLDSDIADIKNSGTREASASQGGVFLQEFVGDTPWAHLDIAGTSMLDKDRAYEPKGCTGVPVRTLVAYVMGW